jgi:hypothetical protein
LTGIAYVGTSPNASEFLVGIDSQTGAFTTIDTIASGRFNVVAFQSAFNAVAHSVFFYGSATSAFHLHTMDTETGVASISPVVTTIPVATQFDSTAGVLYGIVLVPNSTSLEFGSIAPQTGVFMPIATIATRTFSIPWAGTTIEEGV